MPNYEQYLTPDTLVIYPHRGRLFLLALFCMALVAASYFTWNNFTWNSAEEIEFRIVALVGIVLFGLCLMYFVLRLAHPSPSLIITGSGIVDNASALASGFVRWEEIAAVSQRQQFLAVTLKNPDELLQRQPSIKASVMRINMRLFGTPMLIPRSPLPMTLEDVIDNIRQKFPGILVE